MYTNKVENLKIREVFRLTENTIENNLGLYLTAVALLSILSFMYDVLVIDNVVSILLIALINALLALVVKVITLKKIKIDKIGNELISSRVKKGSIGMQILIANVFYFVVISIGIALMLLISEIYILIANNNLDLGLLFIGIITLILIPISIVFTMWLEGIVIEIFCKNEVNKFISKAYLNIFKSKTDTLKKLLLGFLLLLATYTVMGMVITMPQNNDFGMIIITILSNCIAVVAWTYTYIVYMTSITEKDLISVESTTNNNDSSNTLNNTSNIGRDY